MMNTRSRCCVFCLLSAVATTCLAQQAQDPEVKDVIRIDARPIAGDPAVNYDYDIVYCRSPRWVQENGRQRPARWAEFGHPFRVTPGTDLMLLRPDGSEELLVAGGEGSIQDPYVSFDGQWVFFTQFHQAGNGHNAAGADIYKVNIKSKEVVQLTQQQFAPNKEGVQPNYGVYNMHPCPVPGGKVAFVSNRNAYLPPPKSYPTLALQLHVMDEDGSNIETVGHLNLGCALHPVILKDGRLIFSSLENMGLRASLLWGIWSIHPDGTNWAPVVSAFSGTGAPSAFHFQTQLSDENIIIELYYNQNQKGFGTLFKIPPSVPQAETAFGPGSLDDPRNPRWQFLNDRGRMQSRFQLPFTPFGMQSITPWIQTQDRPAPPTVIDDPKSDRIGKLTHPCGAPDNHLLVAWTLGPIGGSAGAVRDYMGPQPIDSGLYLIKDGATTHEPGQMLLIKNDPKYNEQWPRPVVPYRRIYGVEKPRILQHNNDGKTSLHLPEGTPFGLVGTSSLYKRESAPLGAVPEDGVTAEFPADYRENGRSAAFSGSRWNWRGQGADAGRYDNRDIHAIRILSFEPNAHSDGPGSQQGYPAYYSHAMERLRILGEVPVRKFENSANQPLDPDGNPDTSFLAKVPADVAFTFQTIDKDGMVLNMAQTWHQVRPGERRVNCGGCHAHSQQPTGFEETAAAQPDYELFDLTRQTPLLTAKASDARGRRWDAEDRAGLRFEQGPHDVEYWRDVRPIFARSCIACHTKDWKQPAAGLVLDDDTPTQVHRIPQTLPASYARLAADPQAIFGPKPLLARSQHHGWQQYLLSDNASRYLCKFQSRRSLLVWKIYGRRLDGWTNDDIPSVEINPGDRRFDDFTWHDKPLPAIKHHLLEGDIDYAGSQMPPKSAVEGTYRGPDGEPIKVAPLSDEDRRTIVRWIDLGCPIDLHPQYDPKNITPENSGFSADDHRPTLALTYPAAGKNVSFFRVLIGMHDFDSGLNMESFEVTADFPLAGAEPGENLAAKFTPLEGNRWELKLDRPPMVSDGTITVSIADQAGNRSKVVRRFSTTSADD
jgi:hypothetical protein